MLHNWPIRTKLIVILVIPLAALAVLSAIQVRGNVENLRASDRVRVLANFSITSSDLVHSFQQERYTSSTVLSSGYQRGVDLLPPVRRSVDAAVANYRAAETGLPSSTRSSVAPALAAIDSRLDKLASHRKQIDGHKIERDRNTEFYNAEISGLLALDAQIGGGSRNAELVERVATLASISRAKEASAQQRGIVGALIFNGANPALINFIQNQAGVESALLAEFRNTATDEERRLYDTAVGAEAARVAGMRDRVLFAAMQGQQPKIDPFVWLQEAQGKLDKMREVERFVAHNLADTSQDITSEATRSAWLNSIVVVLVLGLSVVVSLLVASPMIRQLRRLRGAALDVAGSRLPSVVERLHRGDPVDIAEETFPIIVRSKDEIGQLSEAFGTVHRVAVHTAIEQAAMRKSIGDTFLNLARRSQALIHRQLKIIDALERKEADPDELDELFRLDHLATRMRRHAEDLIVLSGSKPARGWRRPVHVKDVIRGAVAEVEDYTRVKVLPVSAGAISGHAVGDVIHMLAELIENATSFSPPHTPVHVSGHDVSNGCAIEVEDRGLGMTEEEFAAINTRLANPPPFDLTTSERLGLFVVGRLAERHGIQVRLRSSPYGGTMAIVLVPISLMRAETDASAALAGTEDGEDGAVGSPEDASRPGIASAAAALADARELAPVGALPAPPVPTPRASSPAGASATASSHQPAPDDGASTRAGEHTAADADKAEPAGGNVDDRPLMDDLPVFATVRSSWFIADRNRTPADRRWPSGGSEPAELSGGSGHTGGGQFGSASATGPAPAAESTGQPAGQRAEPRPSGQGSGRGNGRGAHHRPPPAHETTEVGLPKRRRRASLAPQLRRDDTAENPSPAVLAGPRSPEEVRSIMTSFQANFDRGLADGQVTDDDGDTI
jgi:signal transduction histidine kinase